MMHEIQISIENCQTMINFCVHCNMHSWTLTHLCKVINVFQFLSHTFLEYLILTNIVISYVLRFVEDERSFKSKSFLKNKLQNGLGENI
jgi:hypothetical protein